MRKLFYSILLSILPLHAVQGITVACNDYYFGYLLPSIAFIRLEYKNNIPIEIWYAGGELSEKNKKTLSKFKNITFRDCVDVFGGNEKDYWGFQIKAYMLKGSRFDEVMILDADVYLAVDPKELFSHPKYTKTGAFFFRDFRILRFGSDNDGISETVLPCTKWKNGFIQSYWKRRNYFRTLVPTPSKYMRDDMMFFWGDENPTNENKFLFQYQESGLVLIDKRRHRKGVDNILELNMNHKETYKLVHGDKETYWLGMEMAKEPYTFNNEFPVTIRGRWNPRKLSRKKIKLAHRIDGKLIWFQKKPVPLGSAPFYHSIDDKRPEYLPKNERKKLDLIRHYVSMYGNPTKYM